MAGHFSHNRFNRRAAKHAGHARMLEPLISVYQDGEATPEEARTVEQYLKNCAVCRNLLQSYVQLETGLNSYLDSIPAPRLEPATIIEVEAVRRAVRRADVAPLITGSGPAARTERPRRVAGLQMVASLSGLAAAVLVVGAALLYLGLNRGAGQNQGQPVAGVARTSPALPSGATTAAFTASLTTVAASPTASGSPATTAAPFLTTVSQTGPVLTAGTASQAMLTAAPATSAPVAPVVPTVTIEASAPAAVTRLPVSTAPTQLGQRSTPPAPTITTAPPVPTATPTRVVPTPTLPPTEIPPTAVLTVATEPAAAFSATPAVPAGTAPTPTAGLTVTPANPKATAGWIAYIDRSDGQIHLIHSDGSDEQVVGEASATRNITWESLNWSNDGRWLAAVGLEANKPEPSIYLVDINNPRQLNFMSDGIAPVFSPANNLVAYLAAPVSRENNFKSGQPAVYNRSTLTAGLVSTRSESLAPQWFQDGERLLLGQDRIYSLSTRQTTSFTLPFLNTCLAAGLSPAGDRLANLELQSDGKYYTVIYDLSKAKLDPKTPPVRIAVPQTGKIGQNCGAQRVAWSPDSRQVYFYLNASPAFSTCLVQTAAGTARCLANVYDPRFSPDGRYMVDYTPGGLVYVAPAGISARPAEVRPIGETRLAPAWQPAG